MEVAPERRAAGAAAFSPTEDGAPLESTVAGLTKLAGERAAASLCKNQTWQIKADSGAPAKPQDPARCNAPLPPQLGLYKRAPSSAPSPLPRPGMASVSELSSRVDSLMALALKQSEALVALTSHVKLLEQRQTSLFSSRAPSEDGAALEEALGVLPTRLTAPQAHASPSSSEGAPAKPGPGSARARGPWVSRAPAPSLRAQRPSGGEGWRALVWGLLGAGICAMALSLPALRTPAEQVLAWTPV